MDVVVPSICVSSVAGALLFYAGGRLRAPQRPAPAEPVAAPSPDVEEERKARIRAEEELAGAWRSHREAVTALAEERSRSTGLREELADERGARARADAEAANERRRLGEESAELRAREISLAEQVATLRLRVASESGEPVRTRTKQSIETPRPPAQRVAEARLAEVGGERDRARAELERAHTELQKAHAELQKAHAELDTMRVDLDKARSELQKAVAASRRLAGEAAVLRAKVAEHGKAAAQLAAAQAAAAQAEARAADADRLRADHQRIEQALADLSSGRPVPDLAELQRGNVEAALRLRSLEQRTEELARREAENTELTRRVEALAGAAAEAAELRRRVRDLEAQSFARRAADPFEEDDEIPDSVGMEGLETNLDLGLRELCKREEGCRTAVLGDTRGLLIAGYGAAGLRHELAAAASLLTYTAERLRELLPLGEATSLAVIDDNAIAFRTRWLRRQDESFLLATLGAAPAPDDTASRAVRSRLLDLVMNPELVVAGHDGGAPPTPGPAGSDPPGGPAASVAGAASAAALIGAG